MWHMWYCLSQYGCGRSVVMQMNGKVSLSLQSLAFSHLLSAWWLYKLGALGFTEHETAEPLMDMISG